jgi:hypothetical protein
MSCSLVPSTTAPFFSPNEMTDCQSVSHVYNVADDSSLFKR